MPSGFRARDFVIAGLGVTPQGRRLGIPARELRRAALDLALTDAGLERRAVDGYIGTSGEGFDDIRHLGLAPGFAYTMQAGGAGAILSVLNAVGAIMTGQAEVVACVYGATPSAGVRRLDGKVGGYGGFRYGYASMYGLVGAAATHALHARRHMVRHGTTTEHLGAVAVAQRAHAAKRPGALGFGAPISLADHQASAPVVDPFRLLDCCRDTDGGVAVLITTAERAADLDGIAVPLLGLGTGHHLRNWWSGNAFDLHDDIDPAKAKAFAQAGIETSDIDVAALYDPFTISPLMQLEAYGFCAPGEGGPLHAEGGTGLGGLIPTNTGGGQLSGYYAAGFTAVVEGVLQMRGEGGATQVGGAEVALVSGHGGNAGVQNTWSHATMVLGAGR